MKEVYVVMRKCYVVTYVLSVAHTREKALKDIRAVEEGMTPTKDNHYYIEKALYFEC